MLSPKMQRSVRVNENQLIMLSDKAQYDHSMVSAFFSQFYFFIFFAEVVSWLLIDLCFVVFTIKRASGINYGWG